MRGQFQKFKTISILCGLVVLLEFLIFFWTMDGSRYQRPLPQQKTVNDLPRDSLRTLVIQQTWNETKAPLIGLHINKQILPPRLPVHNKSVINETGTNMSVVKEHKKRKMDKIPKYKRFHGKRRRKRNVRNKRIKK